MTQSKGTGRTSYLSREESHMYDKEPQYPLEATSNAAVVEYTLNGLTHLESRRCTLVRISKSSAHIEFTTEGRVADQMTLAIPDARIERLGCVKVREHQSRLSGNKVTVILRFLRLLSDQELASIMKYSIARGDSRRPNIGLGQG